MVGRGQAGGSRREKTQWLDSFQDGKPAIQDDLRGRDYNFLPLHPPNNRARAGLQPPDVPWNKERDLSASCHPSHPSRRQAFIPLSGNALPLGSSYRVRRQLLFIGRKGGHSSIPDAPTPKHWGIQSPEPLHQFWKLIFKTGHPLNFVC